MQLSNVSLPLSFSAKTRVNASDYMLRSEDAKYFEARGNDIGKQSDVIEINIGNKKVNKFYPDQDIYVIKSRTELDGIKQVATTVVPVDKFTPKNYLKKFFDDTEASIARQKNK